VAKSIHPKLTGAAEAVVKAFADVELSSDAPIVPKLGYRNFEAESISEFLRGRDWRGLTLERLRSEYAGDEAALLSFVTPEAFRFYLPAFLLICLREYDRADILIDNTFLHLCTTDIGSSEPTQKSELRLKLLDKAQLTAARDAAVAIQKVYGVDPVLNKAEHDLERFCV
jgi:hypothetical protein